ncbi:hypothetical protein EVAR_46105_1 [Eumeta japonica]|uniref:Uncharacterized protein n=1 Tax=Eumeta variegata TaxID=151549 RepID=A0A4C1XE36_EUMVA|nr:hypothetical protein EVAR_46105_1 [Eumeta japonica]
MDNATSCPPGAEGISKGPLTRALIKKVLAKSLAEMGYECPESELNKFVHTATPISSRASSNTASSASSQNLSRSQCPSKGKNKRKAHTPRHPRKTKHARTAPSSARTASPSPIPPAPRPPPPRGRLDPGPAHSSS